MSTPQAGSQHAAGYLYPASQPPAAPQSSSMGHNQSKPTPPKSLNPLKRAFARRKKAVGGSLPASVPMSLLGADKGRLPPPPLVLDRTEYSPISQVFNTTLVPSSPPPTPPKQRFTPPSPASVTTPSAQLVAPPVVNRNSIMAISPGISSAVNYISMLDQQQRPPASPGSASSNSNSPPSPREMKETWRKSDSTNSHHTIRPGGAGSRPSRPVSWAESFQSALTVVGNGTTSRPLSGLITDADFGMLEEVDDDGSSDEVEEVNHPDTSPRDLHRRSMSLTLSSPVKEAVVSPSPATATASAFTLPPPLPSYAPPNPSVLAGPQKIRPPVLDSPSVLQGPVPSSLPQPQPQPQSLPQAQAPRSNNMDKASIPNASDPPHPAPSQKKASLSQDRELPAIPPPSPPPSYAPAEQGPYSQQQPHHQRIQHQHTISSSSAPVSGPAYGGTWPATPQRGTRTPAISISSSSAGMAGAATLAKKAMEKGMGMGKKWMGLGMSSSFTSDSSPGWASGRRAEEVGTSSATSTASGYSSSTSTSSGAPSSFSGGHGLVKTSSNQSLAFSLGGGGGRVIHDRSVSGSPAAPTHMHSAMARKVTSPNAAPETDPFGMGQFLNALSQGHARGHAHTKSNASAGTPPAEQLQSPPPAPSSQHQHQQNQHQHQRPQGPILGRMLRHPMVGSNNTGMGLGAVLGRSGGKSGSGGGAGGGGGPGLVFKRDLALCVRDTGISVVSARARSKERVAQKDVDVGGHAKSGLVKELEGMRLPALVVRCAQHLLLWGIQEEGLFRVSGMPSHVSKLRAEFDSGADYDMTECTPGDLDPHAVSSVFKAYLRELPEPILTKKLQPYFDAAVNKQGGGNSGPTEPGRLAAMKTGGGGLPSSPKSGLTNTASAAANASGTGNMGMRKPPSLSTLAMPSFTGIPAPSPSLTAAIRALVAQLPEENQDLMRTVVELIRATARESKETKMPLSNLLLVFCPSLNMTPPLLKVLCEAEGIWRGEEDKVIDIRRQTVVIGPAAVEDSQPPPPLLPAKEPEEVDMEEERGSVMSGGLSSDYNASVEDVDDTSSSSLFGGPEEKSRPRKRPPRELQRVEVPTMYLSTRSHCSTTSSVSSLPQDLEVSASSRYGTSPAEPQRGMSRDDTQSVSSGGGYSMNNMPISSSSPPPLSLSAESVATPTTSSGNPSFANLPSPGELEKGKGDEDNRDDTRQEAQIAETDSLELRPQATVAGSPPSNPPPLIQFPTSLQTPPNKRRSVPFLSLPTFSPTITPITPNMPSPMLSPLGSPLSTSGSDPQRSKKPSLKLLFSKRSASSTSLGGKDKSGSLHPHLLVPPLTPGNQAQLSAPLLPYKQSPRSASDSSSVSTPSSAVTAPQSSVPGSGSSTSHFPPVLDTPIEDSSFGMSMGIDTSPPPTATLSAMSAGDTLERAQAASLGTVGATSPTATRRAVMGRSGIAGPRGPNVQPPSSFRPGENWAKASRSNVSLASSTSSLHLSLFDGEDNEDVEDWTQSVLLAADMDVKRFKNL